MQQGRAREAVGSQGGHQGDEWLMVAGSESGFKVSEQAGEGQQGLDGREQPDNFSTPSRAFVRRLLSPPCDLLTVSDTASSPPARR